MKLLILFSLFFLNQILFGQGDTIKYNPDKVFDFFESMPTYPGGEAALLSFINKAIIYPEDAIKAKVEGRVFVCFIMEQDGSLSDVKIIKGLSESLDKEAIRVLRTMPPWRFSYEPFRRTRMILPVHFKL